MWRWFRRWIRRAALSLGVLLLLFLNFLAIAPQGKAAVKSALFVTQVLPIPVKPQEWVTPDPVREVITFPVAGGEREADIYRIPDSKLRPGVLVFLGVNPAPRDDDRVVNLGNGLARAGFVVMFPWSPTMFEKRIDPEEPENLVWAFQYLRNLERVDPERVGMGGFCVGASIALVAASDPRISEDVDFLSAFGAYYDARDLLKQISSKESFYGDTVEPWDPKRDTKEVFTNQLIEGLTDGEEREILANVFVEKHAAADGASAGLSEEGKAVYRLLSSLHATDDQERLTLAETESIMQDLPAGLVDDLAKISPSTNIGNLKARLLIAHDREDRLVPSEESRRLADALVTRGDVRHTEFSFFDHVTPDKTVGPLTFVKEAFKLFRYTYSIIRLTT